jgi:hypothetical protein
MSLLRQLERGAHVTWNHARSIQIDEVGCQDAGDSLTHPLPARRLDVKAPCSMPCQALEFIERARSGHIGKQGGAERPGNALSGLNRFVATRFRHPGGIYSLHENEGPSGHIDVSVIPGSVGTHDLHSRPLSASQPRHIRPWSEGLRQHRRAMTRNESRRRSCNGNPVNRHLPGT